jgi:hypothetical protein
MPRSVDDAAQQDFTLTSMFTAILETVELTRRASDRQDVELQRENPIRERRAEREL